MPGTWLGTNHMTINKIHNKKKQYIKTRSFDKLSQYRLLNTKAELEIRRCRNVVCMPLNQPWVVRRDFLEMITE